MQNMTSKKIFSLMNNEVFEKAIEKVRNLKDINFVTTEARRNYLLSKPSRNLFFR